jgi:hypothetical protein
VPLPGSRATGADGRADCRADRGQPGAAWREDLGCCMGCM